MTELTRAQEETVEREPATDYAQWGAGREYRRVAPPGWSSAGREFQRIPNLSWCQAGREVQRVAHPVFAQPGREYVRTYSVSEGLVPQGDGVHT